MREARLPGVLQRIAGAYFITATVHIIFVKTEDPKQVI